MFHRRVLVDLALVVTCLWTVTSFIQVTMMENTSTGTGNTTGVEDAPLILPGSAHVVNLPFGDINVVCFDGCT